MGDEKDSRERTRSQRGRQVRVPRQRRSIEKAALIKQAALELFSTKGYNKSTTNEIAKLAGVSIGTLYSYFGDKRDIYEELVRDHYMGAAERVEDIDLDELPADMPARETMRMLLATTLESHLVNTAFQREMAALSAQSEELRGIEQKYRGDMAPLIAAYLASHPEYYRVSDYGLAALLVQTSLEAVIHEVVFYPNDLDVDAVLDELADMFCTYLIRPEYL